MNQITVTGRAVETPECRTSENGVSVAGFSIAVDRPGGRSPKNGEGREADFFRVVCFREAAVFAGRYIRKGARVLVTGSLRTRKWQDKTGASRTVTEIIADRTELFDWPEKDPSADTKDWTITRAGVPVRQTARVGDFHPAEGFPSAEDFGGAEDELLPF